MAPSAIDQPAAAPPNTKTYPPAKIFPVKETRFEKFIEPENKGYKRALEQPGSAALVIDNGIASRYVCLLHVQPAYLLCQALPQFGPDGPLNRSRASASLRLCPSIATVSLAKHSPSQATTATQTLPREATFETPSRLELASSAIGMPWSMS
jgi:hypothetical protein